MKIGVLSDTHIPSRARSLPAIIFEAFADAAMILHAGDVACLDVLTELESLAPVYAVRGNIDPPELYSRLPPSRTIEAEGVTIGLIHGDGRSGRTEERALKAFPDADCVVFGHSHTPLCERRGGILLFNPGSPTDRRMQPRHSFGILTVHAGQITGEIITF